MASEKRLIKVVDATAVYNGIALYMAENAYLNDTALDVLKMVAGWLNEAPTVDAVEVVRCQDCKHWKNEINGCTEDKRFCDIGFYMVHKNGFCSFGERKTNEFER